MNVVSNLPCGPSKSKFIQFVNFVKDPTTMLIDCRNNFGNTFTLKFPGQPPYVIVSDPDDVKKLFTSSSDDINAGEINGSVLKPVLGNSSLLTLDGDKHMLHRKLMLPHFHGQRMKFYGEVMQKIALDRIKQYELGESLSVFYEARDMTFDVILQTIFGIEEKNQKYLEIKNLLHELLTTIKSPFGLITLMSTKLHKNMGFITPWAKIQRLKKKIDSVLFGEIERRRHLDLSSRVDILSLLIEAKDKNGEFIKNEEIRDEMLTFLIAGHETTATAIAWCVYYSLANDNVLEKILAEIKTTGICPEKLYEVVDKLTYLDAVLKESLRMMPVVPYIARLTKTEYQLKNRILPKNVAIIPSIYLAHRDAKNWTNPDNFNPERFLESSEKPYTFLPFGGGIRRCIGASFATYEVKIVIATLFLKTELALKDKKHPKLIRKGVVIAPSKGVPVIVKNKFE